MRRVLLSMVAVTFLLTACSVPREQWTWVPARPDAGDLAQAIADCEDYARKVNSDHDMEGFRDARPYGGWGDFSFEFCMNQRGWELQYLKENKSVGKER